MYTEDNSEEIVDDNPYSENEYGPDTIDEEPSYEENEEPQQETTPQLIMGKFKTQEDLEKSYQDLERKFHDVNSKIKEIEKPKLPHEQQEILDQLKELGVVTKEDLSKQQMIQAQQLTDNAEIKSLNLNSFQEKALRSFAAHPDNLNKTMTECWNELSSITSSNSAVLKRKTIIKPKNGNRSTGFKELSQLEIAKLPEKEYEKYWADYAANKARNN